MAAKRVGPPGSGGFFSLFNLPGRAFSPTALAALASAMGSAREPGVARFGSGYVYFGQFVAHDVSRLQPPAGDTTPVWDLEQLRTPVLDLDCVYGEGFDDPGVAVNRFTGEMEIGWAVDAGNAASVPADLPRAGGGVPRIGDERNDENLFVAQLHMRFLKLHNLFAQKLRQQAPKMTPPELYEAARRQLILHYQQAVLYDFLHTVLDERVWDAVIRNNEGTIWNPSPAEMPRMPIEFAAAAFRFGHSAVRLQYDVNGRQAIDAQEMFRMTGAGGLGGRPGLPDTHVVDWRLFFGSAPGELPVNEALLMDVVVPLRVPPAHDLVAAKNLASGNKSGLPDGQALVRHLQDKHPALAARVGLRELTAAELNPVLKFGPDRKRILDVVGAGYGFDACTPLWYYILAEARAMHGGCRLGTLGSLLVAEVLRSLVYLSTPSVLRESFQSSYITPTREMDGRRYVRIIDLLTAVQ